MQTHMHERKINQTSRLVTKIPSREKSPTPTDENSYQPEKYKIEATQVNSNILGLWLRLNQKQGNNALARRDFAWEGLHESHQWQITHD